MLLYFANLEIMSLHHWFVLDSQSTCSTCHIYTWEYLNLPCCHWPKNSLVRVFIGILPLNATLSSLDIFFHEYSVLDLVKFFAVAFWVFLSSQDIELAETLASSTTREEQELIEQLIQTIWFFNITSGSIFVIWLPVTFCFSLVNRWSMFNWGKC